MVINEDRARLLDWSREFLHKILDQTAGTEMERYLNLHFAPGSEIYENLAHLVKAGVRDGWAANIEVDGPVYRRSRIAEPTEYTYFFSVTVVYMDSTENTQGHPDGGYRGQYHAHPYGEFNMVVPITLGAALAGPNGWCNAGWTAPAPGSHHYPEVKGGAVVALFFLPAGRIAYRDPPLAHGI